MNDSDIPPHRKRAKKKRYAIIFSNPHKPRSVFRDFRKNFHSRKAAEQALEDWTRGRGNLARLFMDWDTKIVKL